MDDSTPPTSNDISRPDHPRVFDARPAQEVISAPSAGADSPTGEEIGAPPASNPNEIASDSLPQQVQPAPYDYAAIPVGDPHATVFPELPLTRRQAVVDVGVAFLALLFLFSPVGSLFFGILLAVFPALQNVFEGLLIGGVTVCTVALVLIVRRHWPRTIGLSRLRGLDFLWALAALPACYISLFSIGIIGVMVHFAIGTDMNQMMAEKQEFIELLPERNLLGFLLIGAFTGFHEELLFRGFLLSRFTLIAKNRWLAMFICAAVFGLLHYFGQGWLGVFQTAGIGAVLGAVTILARSLWPAVIAHALFNSIQLALFPLFEKLLEQYVPPMDEAGTTSAPAVLLLAWL